MKGWMVPIMAALFAVGAAQAQTTSESDTATAEAIFAGGCFWCMEPPFDKLEGVLSTTSGYIGGTTPNPTYEEVSGGGTGHAEAVKVVYDPTTVTYAELLEVYWPNVDPLDAGGQFCDRGSQYRSALFPLTEEQRALAEQSKDAVAALLGEAIATTIEEPGPFFPAENYHQDYYQKNPLRYSLYRFTCGRDARLEEVWEGKQVAIDSR